MRVKAPAVKEWIVCRMHGALAGSKPRNAHPDYKHELLTQEAEDLRKWVNATALEARVNTKAMINP